MADRLRASREELAEIAKELGLDPGTDSKWLLWSRMMRRAQAFSAFALAAEQSDEQRKDWPWTE